MAFDSAMHILLWIEIEDATMMVQLPDFRIQNWY